ncbi:MAG TPA: DUF192 domain-containing protein [Candidatus Saccharimonadales bacterium]|nr:DUF192 domain-containing protein [Candidatus Saccharimonadales bacterium]
MLKQAGFTLPVIGLITIIVAISFLVHRPGLIACDKARDNRWCLSLERAVTSEERALGLAGRTSMPMTNGMLFVFEKTAEQCIWMKGMQFDLDIIWLSEDRKINKIAENIKPDTYPKTFCAENTKYVVELNSGLADKLKLHIGDSLRL